MIFTNLAPNAHIRDLGLLSQFFWLPWKWKQWYDGPSQSNVKHWFQEYLATEHVYLADSGRSALYIGLQALGIDEDDEVIVPAYTCIVVTNAIRAVGAVPVLVDIDQDLNINEELIAARITPRTKAILAQHTFGLPVNLQVIRTVCDEHNLFLIEDCAHALGAHYNEQPVGTFGDISFFSFGSDKIVSSVRGGALVVRDARHAIIAETRTTKLPNMPQAQLRQHCFYIVAFAKLKLIYGLVGKALLFLFRRLGMTASIIDPVELAGKRVAWSPVQYPNILAAQAYRQLRSLYKQKMHRRILAHYYIQHVPKKYQLASYAEKSERTYLHFPIVVEDVTSFATFMKENGIQVGTDWNGSVILPKKAVQTDVQGTFPVGSELSKKVVQLPIHQNMTIRKAKRVIHALQRYQETHA